MLTSLAAPAVETHTHTHTDTPACAHGEATQSFCRAARRKRPASARLRTRPQCCPQVVALRRDLKTKGRGYAGARTGSVTGRGVGGRVAPPDPSGPEPEAKDDRPPDTSDQAVQTGPLPPGDAAAAGPGPESDARLLELGAENDQLRRDVARLAQQVVQLGHSAEHRDGPARGPAWPPAGGEAGPRDGTHAHAADGFLRQQLAAALSEAAAHKQIALRTQELLHSSQLEHTEKIHAMLQGASRARGRVSAGTQYRSRAVPSPGLCCPLVWGRARPPPPPPPAAARAFPAPAPRASLE